MNLFLFFRQEKSFALTLNYTFVDITHSFVYQLLTPPCQFLSNVNISPQVVRTHLVNSKCHLVRCTDVSVCCEISLCAFSTRSVLNATCLVVCTSSIGSNCDTSLVVRTNWFSFKITFSVVRTYSVDYATKL